MGNIKNIKYIMLSCDCCFGEGIVAMCEIDEVDNELRQWGVFVGVVPLRFIISCRILARHLQRIM